jgi:hypothetical protein
LVRFLTQTQLLICRKLEAYNDIQTIIY